MNRKFATLLFALGLGAASAPAFASCDFFCNRDRTVCLAGTQYTDEECNATYEACAIACYGCPDRPNGECW